MKRIFSYLLAGLLCCCLFLTGCSHKEETMFSTLKEINQISSYEVHTQADINMETDGESTPISLTVDGAAGSPEPESRYYREFWRFQHHFRRLYPHDRRYFICKSVFPGFHSRYF